jgi:hypothetical protein
MVDAQLPNPRLNVGRAAVFALSWVTCAGGIGSLLGALTNALEGAIDHAGLTVWAFSGIAVGAAQWALVCRRLQVSALGWIAATAFGSFLTMSVYFYLGVLVTKGAANFSNLLVRYGDEVALYSVVVMLVGGLTIGIPQAVLLRDTRIRWWIWPSATMLGVLGAWLGDLGLWDAILGRWPRQIEAIIHMSSYWLALSIPQALVIGHAVKMSSRSASPSM